jgi:heme/copper-type cytochrome/quinol oxidase subunit 3
MSTFWFRDLLRELNKKYEVLLIIFFLVFLLFLVSEGLLFVSFFWTSFHSSSSPSLGIWPGEGFYVDEKQIRNDASKIRKIYFGRAPA